MLAATGVAFALLQGACLVADQDVGGGHPFLRPGSGERPGVVATPGEVDRLAAEARACEPGLAYSGPPFVAFVAGRRPPGDQPDGFITEHAERNAGQQRRREQDLPVCP